MNKAKIVPLEDGEFCPFFDETPIRPATGMYKVYNDGGHFIAYSSVRSNHKCVKRKSAREAIDLAFDDLYRNAKRNGRKDAELEITVKDGLRTLFPDYPDLDDYVSDKIEKAYRNKWKREKRFRRKAFLNKWNYFVTFTFDDKKQNEETFRKKLRKCLANLHTRRGWRYMGVFERAPETDRLHFHGIFYIPDGEMLGGISEKQDYSTAKGQMQTYHENSFFEECFGRNDFAKLDETEIRRGKTVNYILKYLDKSGERIVYCRGIKSEIYLQIDGRDIVTEMQDFGTKYILFDDVIDWRRDVLCYTNYKQINMYDIICNSVIKRLIA